MKKWFPVLLVIIIFLLPTISLAAHSPLVLKNRSVYIPDDNDIELVSYNIFFRIRTGYSSANTFLVVKNRNLDEEITFKMGMPIQIDNISRIRDLSVIADGNSLKVSQRSTHKKPPTENKVDVNKWYVWDISLDPGESKEIECTFSFDNKLELDGTEVISFPLEFLQYWAGDITNLQIIADLDFYGPYVFDPISPVMPIQYDNVGRLTYRWSSFQSIPTDFELSFKPMDVVITRYIESQVPDDKVIKSILEAYKNKSYYKAIALIHDFLSGGNDFEMLPELRYLEALCYQSLFDFDKSLNLFNQLEPNPGFGESLSNAVKNKIIYDKTSILKTQVNGGEKALEYLLSIKDSDFENHIFSLWLDKEISLLTPTPTPEDPLEDEPNAQEKEGNEKVQEDEPKVITKVAIGEYEFYIDEILMVALVLIIIIIIVASIVKRKKKRRRSIFRY